MIRAFVLTLQTSLPLIFAQIAFAANTFATQFFLANHSGTALQASLPASMLAVTFMVFFNATLGYAGTIFARRHSSGDTQSAMTAFVQSVWLTLFSLPLLALALPLARIILACFQTSAEVLAEEVRYFDILMLNAAFTILAQVLSGFFTGQGRTRFVGFVTVFGFAVNIAISPFFIAGLGNLPSGVAGAGIAQTIAHIIPCILLAIAVLRHPAFRETTFSLKPSLTAHETLEILRLGIPNGLRTVLEIGSFFLFTAVIAECEAPAVAASTALFAINGIPHGCVQGLASAIEILTGRASGRNDTEAIRGIIKSAALLTGGIVLLYAFALVVFQEPLLSLFLPSDQPFDSAAFRSVAHTLCIIAALKAAPEFTSLILQGFLRGLGATAAVFRIQLFSISVVWMPVVFAVRYYHQTVPDFWLTMFCACIASSILLFMQTLITKR